MRSRLQLIVLAAAVALAGGCAPLPPKKPLKVRLAVLDFLPPGADYNQAGFAMKTREGWWMGGTDIYRQQHVGIQVADVLASRLNRSQSITVYLREDFRQYLADKADVLRKAYPDLTDAQLAETLQKTQQESALKIGADLNVDRVLSGQVLAERMTHNRTWHGWRSSVTVQLAMWDVEKGAKILDRKFTKRKWFASPQLTMEALAEDVAKLLAQEYGHP